MKQLERGFRYRCPVMFCKEEGEFKGRCPKHDKPLILTYTKPNQPKYAVYGVKRAGRKLHLKL